VTKKCSDKEHDEMKMVTVRVGSPGDYEHKDVPECTVRFLRWWYGLFGESVTTTGGWNE
jgi:hypothetical protein